MSAFHMKFLSCLLVNHGNDNAMEFFQWPSFFRLGSLVRLLSNFTISSGKSLLGNKMCSTLFILDKKSAFGKKI